MKAIIKKLILTGSLAVALGCFGGAGMVVAKELTKIGKDSWGLWSDFLNKKRSDKEWEKLYENIEKYSKRDIENLLKNQALSTEDLNFMAEEIDYMLDVDRSDNEFNYLFELRDVFEKAYKGKCGLPKLALALVSKKMSSEGEKVWQSIEEFLKQTAKNGEKYKFWKQRYDDICEDQRNGTGVKQWSTCDKVTSNDLRLIAERLGGRLKKLEIFRADEICKRFYISVLAEIFNQAADKKYEIEFSNLVKKIVEELS